jgi:hypothetical protein
VRKAVRLSALVGLVVWLLRRRAAVAAHEGEGVTIGFDDGSSTTLEVGSLERELLLAAAGDLV